MKQRQFALLGKVGQRVSRKLVNKYAWNEADEITKHKLLTVNIFLNK